MGGRRLVDPGAGGPSPDDATTAERLEQGVVLAARLIRADIERSRARERCGSHEEGVSAAVGFIDQLIPGRTGAAEEALQIGLLPRPGGGRAALDRPEDNIGLQRLLRLDEGRQPPRRGDLVVIEEGDQIGVGRGQRGVPRGGDPRLGRMDIDDGERRLAGQGLDPRAGGTLRIVVGHHQAVRHGVGARLAHDGTDRTLQFDRAPQGRDDDREGHAAASSRSSTSATVAISAPPAFARWISRLRAPGVHPQGDGSGRTSCV